MIGVPSPPCDVEIIDVCKHFGHVVVLNDVSLQVGRGKFFSLPRPSGSGKTTLLRLNAGFLAPDAGGIRIAGKEVVGLPLYQRNVNTVFQHSALFPQHDVWGNVAYGCRQQRITDPELRRRVDEALTMSDRIAIMNEGRVLQLGTLEEIYERPSCRFVADVIGDTNAAPGRVQGTDDKFTRVATMVGRVQAFAGTRPASDTRMSVTVRPEKLTLLPKRDLAGMPRGRVGRVVNTSVSSRVQVRVNDGTLFQTWHHVDTRGSDQSPDVSPGAEAMVTRQPQDALILLG